MNPELLRLWHLQFNLSAYLVFVYLLISLFAFVAKTGKLLAPIVDFHSCTNSSPEKCVKTHIGICLGKPEINRDYPRPTLFSVAQGIF